MAAGPHLPFPRPLLLLGSLLWDNSFCVCLLRGKREANSLTSLEVLPTPAPGVSARLLCGCTRRLGHPVTRQGGHGPGKWVGSGPGGLPETL